MRSYWIAIVIGLVLLSFTTLASAVSPGVVRAVADRPLVVTLEDESVLEVEVVELGDDTVVVIDSDGSVSELAYDDIRAVRVNSSAAEEAAEQEDASVRERLAAARERDEAEAAAGRREAEAQRRSSSGPSSYGQSREEQGAGDSGASIPRLYSRFGVNIGYGSLRSNVSEAGDSLTLRSQGLNVGFNAAIGARLAESFAVHLSAGTQRFFRVSERASVDSGGVSAQSSFQAVDYAVRTMNFGIGATFMSSGFVASTSIGTASARIWDPDFGIGDTNWGVGGDVLVGYAMEVASALEIGAGLSLNWLLIPRNDDDLKTGGYTIGPQFFISH